MNTVELKVEFCRLHLNYTWDLITRELEVPIEIYNSDDESFTEMWIQDYICDNFKELAEGNDLQDIIIYYIGED